VVSAEDLYRAAQFNPWIPVGFTLLTSFRGHGLELWARHPSDLTPGRCGARWHVSGEACPTWADATECRCMVEGC
jgi:hypothetical protein